jgi:glycosyltransferase involved in cell wall biosynthesis
VDVTLFATADSITSARLSAVCPRPYEEDAELDAKVWECLHISAAFERAAEFDLIHNHFDFLPLSYSGLVQTPVLTTIHGFSSERILPVYQKYNRRAFYVSISDADRRPGLDYIDTVYHGIPLDQFSFQREPGKYLLAFGRIHPDKGTAEAIEVARQCSMQIVIAGIIQDRDYFESRVKPHLDGNKVCYVGSAGPELRNELLGGAFALLHLINFEEPFGLSMVEAMACGTPVIAAPRGSIPEIIVDGVNGFFASTNQQALLALERVPTLDRARIRELVAQRFSQEAMVEAYLQVYRKVLERSNSRSTDN